MSEALPTTGEGAVPAGLRVWWLGIRPKTLSLAAVPVLVGTALAVGQGAAMHWPAALVALVSAVLIQAATNLHNDAADFERGGDGAQRHGPARVTAEGWVTPKAVKRAALLCFAGAALGGLYLVSIGGWMILCIGVASLLAGWGYSGGWRPISHTALGEVFVLLFFGVAAVAGSFYLQRPVVSVEALLLGLAVGAMAAAVLLVNNTRDLEQDRLQGRRTLAIRAGRRGSVVLYGVFMLAPFTILPFVAGGLLLPSVVLPWAVLLIWRFRYQPPGPGFNALLVGTARAQALFGGLLMVGLLLP